MQSPLLPILTKLQAELATLIANMDTSFHLAESETTRRALVTLDDLVSEVDHAVTAICEETGVHGYKNYIWDGYKDNQRTELCMLFDKQREDEDYADSPAGIAASRSDDLHNRRMEA